VHYIVTSWYVNHTLIWNPTVVCEYVGNGCDVLGMYAWVVDLRVLWLRVVTYYCLLLRVRVSTLVMGAA